jgi:hypothetical protein
MYKDQSGRPVSMILAEDSITMNNLVLIRIDRITHLEYGDLYNDSGESIIRRNTDTEASHGTSTSVNCRLTV